MSSFMDYLNEIDLNIVEDDIEDEIIETEIIKKQDASVDLVENRIIEKLHNIGLNDTVISDVVEYVLGDIGSINENKIINNSVKKSPTKKKKKKKINKHNDGITSIADRASNILEGVVDNGNVNINNNTTYNNMSSVANHASSLL